MEGTGGVPKPDDRKGSGQKAVDHALAMHRAPSVDDLFAPMWGLNVNVQAKEEDSHDDSSSTSKSHVPAHGSSSSATSAGPEAESAVPCAPESVLKGNPSAAFSPDMKGGLGISTSNANSDSGTESQRIRVPIVGQKADPTLPLSQSGSDDEQGNGGVDERKKKRMVSNRESARRSRLRKQKQLEMLQAKIAQFKAENAEMLSKYSLAAQRFSLLNSENHILRAEAGDLVTQLESLNATLASKRTDV